MANYPRKVSHRHTQQIRILFGIDGEIDVFDKLLPCAFFYYIYCRIENVLLNL
jgi:hypothetical protein